MLSITLRRTYLESLQVGALADLLRLRCRVPVPSQALSPTSGSQRPNLEAFVFEAMSLTNGAIRRADLTPHNP